LSKSQQEAERLEKEEADTVTALASLSMQGIIQENSRLTKEEPMEEN